MKTSKISQKRIKRLLGKHFHKEDHFGSINITTDRQAFSLATELYMFTSDPFNDTFVEVSNKKSPKGMMGSLVNYLIENTITEFTDKNLEKAYNISGYKENFDKVAIKFFEKKYDEHVLAKLSEKIPITHADSYNALDLAMLTLSDYDVANLVNIRNIKTEYHRKQIAFSYKAQVFVVFPSYLVVDKVAGTITPIDFKVSDRIDVQEEAKERRWDLLAALYTLAIKEWLITRDLKYKVLPFHFVVARTKVPEHPVILPVSESTLYTATHGKNDKVGILQLFDEYIHKKENKEWNSSSVNTDKLELWN